MTAQELIERMTAAYAAYSEGEAEPFCELFAADGMVRHAAPPDIFGFAAPRRGPDGVHEVIDLIVKDYQWLSYRNLEMVAEDDRLFALGGGRIRHKPSGRETVMHLADLVHFQGGQIAEFVQFFDTAGVYDWVAGTSLPASAVMNPGNKAVRTEAAEAERNKAALAGVYEAYRRHDAGPLFDLLAEDRSWDPKRLLHESL